MPKITGTITVDFDADMSACKKLRKDLSSLRPVLSQLPDELLEKLFLGIGRDLKLDLGMTPRTNNCIGVSVVPGDNTIKIIAALRAGEMDAASCVAAFCHDSPPP